MLQQLISCIINMNTHAYCLLRTATVIYDMQLFFIYSRRMLTNFTKQFQYSELLFWELYAQRNVRKLHQKLNTV